MKIEHIAIWVKDLEKMRVFYEKYFNGKSNEKYRNEKKDFESYFISFDSGARLELMQMPNIPDSKNDVSQQYMGLIHFAISVGNEEQVANLTEKIANDGYEIIGQPRWTGDGYYESVILDPEQNRIEITN
ncbi:VOC family protein [Emticicia sp.]|uniref:VOC family protein n=1 Tax=Emticicia sp. TaxID=1930953 RepID=UPI00375110B0